MLTDVFKYVDIVGTMQLSNEDKTWRGIDHTRVENCPFPVPSEEQLSYTKKIITNIHRMEYPSRYAKIDSSN